jgi:hypothetical protein
MVLVSRKPAYSMGRTRLAAIFRVKVVYKGLGGSYRKPADAMRGLFVRPSV